MEQQASPSRRWQLMRPRSKQRGVALLETLVFFGAIVLLYVSATHFGARWQASHQAHHITQAALFDAAWGRSTAQTSTLLAGKRPLSVRSHQTSEGFLLELVKELVGAAIDGLFGKDGDFVVEPFSARLIRHEAHAKGHVDRPTREVPSWLQEEPLDLKASMLASTPACWWPNTFFFDFAVAHYTIGFEHLGNPGSQWLLDWGL